MLNGFTFDGINSLDYGFYISSASVYDAPKRVVEMTDVPGKNGALAVDTGRFENIEVKYHVYSVCDTQEEFSENIQAFRNAVCSRYDYVRLTDDYNAGEYRLALYKNGLSVNAPIDRYGGFDVVFECKPQRFLTSGETERSIPEWSDLHTDSGSIVTIDNSGGEYAVKSLSTAIEPQQSGSGDPSPTNIRPITGFDSASIYSSGKNMLRHIYPSETKNGVTFTENANGTISTSGTATANAEHSLTYRVAGSYGTCFLKAGTYILSGCPSGGGSTKYEIGINTTINGSGVTLARDYGDGATFTLQNDGYVGTWVTIRNGQDASGLTFKPMIEQGSTATAYETYNGNTYTVSFGTAGTVYGGTLDVVSGQLTVTHQIIDLSTLTWTYGSAYSTTGRAVYYATNTPQKTYQNSQLAPCYAEKYISAKVNDVLTTTGLIGQSTNNRVWCSTTAQATTPTGNFVYELATPLTYQLTATQVALLLGTNNVWSDTGDTEIEYGKGGYTLFNPTPFDSLPLLKVTGTGTLGVGSWIITITGTASQVIYIDCDIMDAYKITGGIIESANNLVSFNKVEFPRLVSGLNNFSIGTGITEVKVTPRWWRV